MEHKKTPKIKEKLGLENVVFTFEQKKTAMDNKVFALENELIIEEQKYLDEHTKKLRTFMGFQIDVLRIYFYCSSKKSFSKANSSLTLKVFFCSSLRTPFFNTNFLLIPRVFLFSN